jgi:hypothetical protein
MYPRYGDSPLAWAPSRENDSHEFLTLQYQTPVYLKKIEIYETFNPGSVNCISVLNPDGEWIVVWESGDTNQSQLKGSSRIFSPTLKLPVFLVSVVKIDMDTHGAISWSEIDAVRLTGNPYTDEIFVKTEAYLDQDVDQWVELVLGFSSEYNGWPATNVLGESNTYPNYGDLRTAWAPLRSKGEYEFLVVKYANPVYVTGISIYETYNPGAIFLISCQNLLRGWDVLWEGNPHQNSVIGKSRIFSPELAQMNYMTNTIRIDMNTRDSASWSEIDAIKLIGNPFDRRKKVIYIKVYLNGRGFDTRFHFQ